MSDTTRRLIAKFEGDTSDLRRASAKAEQSLKGVDRSAAGADKSSRGLGAGVGKLAGKLAVGLAALQVAEKAMSAFGSSIRDASDAKQSIGGAAAVFKKNAAAIEKSADAAAGKIGLSANQYRVLATTLGAGLKNKGIRDFTGETQKLLDRGADLAAMYGGTTAEAVEAISSLMRGEADPIERYGVAISETAVNAELAARGQTKLTGSALETAKAQARLAILMRQTSDAHGAAARESDTLAAKQQQLAARWDNLSAAVGERFLPYAEAVAKWAADDFLPALDKLSESGGAFDQWLADATAAGQVFYERFIVPILPGLEQVGRAFDQMSKDMGPVVSDIFGGLQRFAEEHGPEAERQLVSLQETTNQVLGIIAGAIEAWSAVTGAFWDKWGGTIMGVASAVGGMIMGQIGGTLKIVEGITGTILAAMRGDWSGFFAATGKILDGFKQRFQSVFDGISKIAKIWGQNFGNFIKPGINTAIGYINKLIGAYNSVAKVVKAPTIGTVSGIGVSRKFSGSKGGRAEGGWTGPGAKWDEAGTVHADEFVIKKASRRRFEDRFPGYLAHINATGTLPEYAEGGQVRPVPGGWTTYSGHRGIDFPVPTGTPVHAWRSGLVRTVTTHPSWGKYVQVDHGGNLWSAYAHLSRFATRVGAALSAGQTLGYVGSTGNSTGPHLHWEIWRGGTRVNPAPYLSGAKGWSGAKGGGASATTAPPAIDLSALKRLVDGVSSLITGTDASRMTAGVVSKAGNALLDKARLFDRGGVLPPGLTLARNDTGRDEHILTDEQLSAVASGRPVTVTVTADHAGFRDLIRAEIADDRARRG